jgi:serine protease Do
MKSAKAKFGLLLAVVFAVAFVGGGLGSFVFAKNARAESATDSPVGYDAVYSTDNPIPEIAANVRPSVVQVIESAQTWAPGTSGTSEQEIGYGSGTYIRAASGEKGGYILTNYHVVEEGDSYKIVWLDGTEMNCELTGYDNGTDIAILRFRDDAPTDATPVTMGDSDSLQIGELVIAIGNPGAADYVLYGTVTSGIVSGLAREEISAGNFTRSVSVIQTDAAINSGNSGGALLNSKGELVGIPTLKISYSDTSVYEGLGFCVPINTVKSLIDEIITTGKVSRPMLGVGVADFDGPDDPTRNYPPAGVIVKQVTEGSSAQEQGILPYDIITEINGTRIKSYAELTAVLDTLKAGDVAQLKAYRYYDQNGNMLEKYEEMTFNVELRLLGD